MSKFGAEFRKCDLQIHSPRDSGWDGARPDAAGGDAAARAATRIAFCKSLIDKCRAEGVKAIALTDHHEGVYIKSAQLAKAELVAQGMSEDDFWIFPGMELTFRDSCQGLLIFDCNIAHVLFEKARSKLGLPSDCSDERPTGIQVELLSIDISDLQQLFDDDDELRHRFILLPHVKPGGHKTVLRAGFHKRFREMPYVGGYMDRCYPDQLNDGDRRILDGEIPAWSSEKRGVISTSDSRFADFRLVGKHCSWLKLAAPTAESIRQAMLAPDSRIRHQEPKLPSVVITRLLVSGAAYLANAEYFFNQQMNSVIGGRGAGKSTLLEYLRFALGCSAIDAPNLQSGEKAASRMREMLEGTFSGGSVTADVLLNGTLVEVRRTMSSRSTITLTTNGVQAKSTPEEVAALIPVQPFRQGELSDLARHEMAEKLLDLVTANAADQLNHVRAALRGNGQQLSSALAKAVRLTSAQQKLRAFDTESRLLRSQIDSLQSQLNQGSTAPGPAVSEHDKYLEENRGIEEVRSEVAKAKKRALDSLNGSAESLRQIVAGRPALKVPELLKLYEHVTSELEPAKMSEISDAISAKFDSLEKLVESHGQLWRSRYEQHLEDYSAQKALLSGKEDLLGRLEELNGKLTRVSAQLDAATTEEREFRTADQELQDLRNERNSLRSEFLNIVATQAQTINEKSGGLAYGQVSATWDLTDVEAAVRAVLDLPMLREKRIETLLDPIRSAAEPAQAWDALVDEILSLVRWKEGSRLDGQPAPETPALQRALDINFLDKLRASISSDAVAVALRAIVRPQVDLFQRRGQGAIEFRKASQGEQAATLLNILMNQSKGPLIIDQPEEDLDNRIINDIIRTIRSTKDERQIILCTHNANIAVNGDSELVIEMAMGAPSSRGAIDESQVRDAITNTMEGGRDAFDLRRRKYNF